MNAEKKLQLLADFLSKAQAALAESDREVDPQETAETFYQVGGKYLVRTVTFSYTGRVVEVRGDDLVLEDAAWIAHLGRFADALKTGEFEEVEPYPDGTRVALNRASFVDGSEWPHALPRHQK